MEFIRYEADVALDVESVNIGATTAMAGRNRTLARVRVERADRDRVY